MDTQQVCADPGVTGGLQIGIHRPVNILLIRRKQCRHHRGRAVAQMGFRRMKIGIRIIIHIVAATAAVLVAAVLEKCFGWQLDGWFGLGVAVFILLSGVSLAKETISPLLGESGNPELRRNIIATISAHELVLGYHDLMVHDYGPGQRFATMHVEMDKSVDPLVCHDIIDDLERQCYTEHGVHLVIHYDPVVTGDQELEAARSLVCQTLSDIDSRITIHDFRMVTGTGHTNLIFDMALPYELMEGKKAIKQRLDEALNAGATRYYTVVTFDGFSFNNE